MPMSDNDVNAWLTNDERGFFATGDQDLTKSMRALAMTRARLVSMFSRLKNEAVPGDLFDGFPKQCAE